MQARLWPALLVILPVPIALTMWIPMENLPKFPLWCTPLTLAATFFLAQLGRDAGKRAEPALWQSWDGPPTTRRLRHRNRDLNPVIRVRQHEKLSELMHAPLPTLQEEIDDPIRADATYEAAVLFLRREHPGRCTGFQRKRRVRLSPEPLGNEARRYFPEYPRAQSQVLRPSGIGSLSIWTVG